jgi:hypothetical protein
MSHTAAGTPGSPQGGTAIRFDLVAGLTAAAVVLPKAMAYATVAGLPVAVGLYTAFVPMLIYALLGSSRVLTRELHHDARHSCGNAACPRRTRRRSRKARHGDGGGDHVVPGTIARLAAERLLFNAREAIERHRARQAGATRDETT